MVAVRLHSFLKPSVAMTTSQSLAAAAPSESGWVYASDRTPILRYELEKPNRILHVQWQSSVLLDDVKRGFLEIAHQLRVHECVALLSDSDHYGGDWSDLIPWVRYEFLPQVIAHGLRFMADVQPEDPANSFSVYSWREETRGIMAHEVFPTLETARAWLREVMPAELLERKSSMGIQPNTAKGNSNEPPASAAAHAA
jgi:hypothetical protein